MEHGVYPESAVGKYLLKLGNGFDFDKKSGILNSPLDSLIHSRG